MLTSGTDSHNIIKTENDKMYHFAAAHHFNKTQQILSDTKMTPTQMFDVRNADGQIVHVNIEDINQFLTYHEVFGKISSSEHFPTSSSTSALPINPSNQTNPQLNAVITAHQQLNTNQGNQNHPSPIPTPLIIPKIESIPNNSAANATTASTTTTTTTTTTNASTPSTCIVNPTVATDDATAMPSPGIHTCDICGKMFPFKYQFIVHRRYHNERKPFICQVCGQAFTTSTDLTQHGKCHDGVKMFICNICYNVFANDASLERHMKRHSTDKPFGCTVCQKTFARKEHLENHFRSHTGEHP